ncbi:MAG: hybrid sensor histidine kinase/response regulator [Myxococcota bacterium]
MAPPTDSPSYEMLVAFVGISCVSGSLGATLGALSMWRFDNHFGALAMAALALLLVGGVISLRAGIGPRPGAATMVGGLFVTWAVVVLSTGGENVGVLFAGNLVPLFAVLVLGARTGLASTFAVVGIAGLTWGLRRAGFEFPVAVDRAGVAEAKFVAAVSLPFLTYIALFLHHEMRRVAQREAERETSARVGAELRRRALSEEFDRLRILAGSVAHDFNNFLTAIRGNAEIATFSVADDPDLRESLETIQKSADKAAGVVGELVAFARRGGAQRTTIDLRDAVTDVLEVSRNAFDEPIDLDLAQAARPMWVSVDPDGLSSVLLNLLKNAFEAARGDTARVRIETRSEWVGREVLDGCTVGSGNPAGEYASVSIIDAGCGLRSDEIEGVFEPFVSRKQVGRGLGLAVARTFTENHEGAIEVTSEPGRTCFRVLLPLAGVPEMATTFSSPQGFGLEGRRILVVDDDPSVRRVVSAMLRNQGASVLEAAGGRPALQILESSESGFDVALIDMAMPDLGGEETFHGLRRLDPELPAVIMSGHAAAQFDHLAELPGVRTLAKPFSLARLAHEIRELLG